MSNWVGVEHLADILLGELHPLIFVLPQAPKFLLPHPRPWNCKISVKNYKLGPNDRYKWSGLGPL